MFLSIIGVAVFFIHIPHPFFKNPHQKKKLIFYQEFSHVSILEGIQSLHFALTLAPHFLGRPFGEIRLLRES
jgi:hypothetical protein